MATKQCSKCGAIKPHSDFYATRGKLYSHCKTCHAKRAREIRARPGYNDWHREYRQRNKERLNALARAARAKKPEKQREYTRKWRANDPARALFYAAKHRARLLGIDFSLTRADVVVPAACPILGIPFGPNTGRGMGAFADSPSLDRIDPSLGYVPGNVQVISRRANTMKNDASREELLAFAEWIRRKYA